MKVVAAYNYKGGPGKTTLSVHLATLYAAWGYRTVLVGMDGQGDSLRWLTGGEADIANGTVLPGVKPNLAAIFSSHQYPDTLRRAAKTVDVVIADLAPEYTAYEGVPADLWLVPVDGRMALENLMTVLAPLRDAGGQVLVVYNRAGLGGKVTTGQLRRAASQMPGIEVWPEMIPASPILARAGELYRTIKEVPYGLGSQVDKMMDGLAAGVLGYLGLSGRVAAQVKAVNGRKR